MPHRNIDGYTHFLISALSAASGSAAALFGEEGFLVLSDIFWASLGSGAALITTRLSAKEKLSIERFFRQLLPSFLMFFVGAAFGIALGSSFANIWLIEDIAGLFIGGAIGWGVMLVITEPAMIARWTRAVIRGAVNGLSGTMKNGRGGDHDA